MKQLGFGLMRLPLTDEKKSTVDLAKFQEMVDYYMKNGYNYFDTAHVYLKGNSEKAIKECITSKYPRESFVLTTKLPIFNLKQESDMEEIFNEQLTRCGVEYFDYYLLHNLSSKHEEKFTKIDSFDFILKKKQEGKVKHIGISSHDTPEFLEQILIQHPEIEVVQLQINFLDWEDEIINSRRCYETARKYSKKIIIMEPLKGGSLIDLPHDARKILDEHNNEKPLSWAFRFCESLEGVMIILSGMNSLNEVKENITLFEEHKPLTQEETELLDKVSTIINMSTEIKCTQCKYCLSYCPQNIDISFYFRIYNSQNLLPNEHSLKMYYNNFVSNDNPKPSECLKCGNCVDYCPQHINIPQKLELVSKAFE